MEFPLGQDLSAFVVLSKERVYTDCCSSLKTQPAAQPGSFSPRRRHKAPLPPTATSTSTSTTFFGRAYLLLQYAMPELPGS